MNRRNVLWGALAGATVGMAPMKKAWGFQTGRGSHADQNGLAPQRIEALELVELRGHYEAEAGVNGQKQVSPLDIYEDQRSPDYKDKPAGTRKVETSAIYLRIKTSGDLEGLYGPHRERTRGWLFTKTCGLF